MALVSTHFNAFYILGKIVAQTRMRGNAGKYISGDALFSHIDGFENNGGFSEFVYGHIPHLNRISSVFLYLFDERYSDEICSVPDLVNDVLLA